LRAAELDAVFADAVERGERPSPDRVALALRPSPEIAARVADLAVRETGCCSFFTFTSPRAAMT
jgi:hypothetical protein